MRTSLICFALLAAFLLLAPIESTVGVSVYYPTDYLNQPIDTTKFKVKERRPSAPRATLLTELLVFDRVFYYFPFGFYNKVQTYNSAEKEPYVI